MNWTEEEIAILRREGAVKIQSELAELLPSRTPRAISAMRQRLGIILSPECYARSQARNNSLLNCDVLCKLNQSITLEDLDNTTWQVLIGSLLGDGCVKYSGNGARYRNCIFAEGHGTEQQEYVYWKTKMLSIFLPKVGRGKKPEMWTVSHPIFTLLRDKFYDNRRGARKSKLPFDVLARMDELGLMVWYLDDGNLGRERYPTPIITSKCFDYDSLIVFAQLLNERLGLRLYVKKYKHFRGGWFSLVKLTPDDRRRLFHLWQYYVERYELPKCLHYKLSILEG